MVFVFSVVKASSMRRTFVSVLCGLITVSGSAQAADGMNAVAERYVHLVLALGQHDPDYVDAFYGPAEWKTRAEKEKKSLDQISEEVGDLILDLPKTGEVRVNDEMLTLRREYLRKQVDALFARVMMLKGVKFTFD